MSIKRIYLNTCNQKGTEFVYICKRTISPVAKLFKLFLFVVIMLSAQVAEATHLVGGYLTYRFLGSNGTQTQYRVTLYVYRDCIKDGTDDEVPFDDEITLCIYNSNRSYFSNRTVSITSKRKVDPVGNTNCPEVKTACLDQGIYETTITVPNTTTGYHIKWERCCRNTQNNLRDDNTGTPYQGQTYYGFIPASSLKNSAPVFQDVPVPFICARDTTVIRFRALDQDGDSLSYRFVTPWQGASGSTPILEDCPSTMTSFDDVEYVTGFNASRPFGATGVAQIDAFNGLTTYYAPAVGRYAVCIEVTEWRNGVKISTVRLDLQVLVINCKPNNKPRLSYQGGTTTWTVEAGATICRDVTATDQDVNDVVTLRAFGDIFTGANGFTGTRATVNPSTASGRPTATTKFCWKTDCNHASATPYRVIFEAYDNGCPSKFINQNVLIYVTPFNPPEKPDGKTQVCQNEEVVYTALTPKAGNTYRWRVYGGTILNGDSTSSTVRVMWGNGITGRIELFITSVNGCVVGPRFLDVLLIPAPSKPRITGSDTVCLNASSVFNAAAQTGITGYNWSVSGGVILGSATLNSVNVRWNTKGNGFVRLVVTNAQGCASPPDTFRVFVSHPNTPPITGPVSVCPNNKDIEYQVVNPNAGSLYRWFVTGGVQSFGGLSSNIRINWGGLGVGTVKVVEINKFGCVGDTVYLTVIKNHALAGQLPKGDTSICEFSSGLRYSISPVRGETYNWIVTGGTIMSGQGTSAIVVDWGAAGTGSVGVQSTAYDSISGLPCLSPVRARIVNIRPYPAKTPVQGIFEVCEQNGNASFTLAGFPGSVFEWEINGLNFTGQGTGTISFGLNTNGTFKVRVREISQYGCTGPWNDTTLIIYPKPRTSALSGDFIVCFPRLSGYNYSVKGFAGSTYQWSLNGGQFNPSPSANDSQVRVDWNGQQISGISVLEISDFGCLGDTIKAEVFIDNPSIISRFVSITPPPLSDERMEVHYRLINAPRYNKLVYIQRRPRGGSGNFSTVAAVNPNDTIFSDPNILQDSLSYEYRAVAVNLCGDSIYSNQNTSVLLKGRRTGPFSMTLNFTDYSGWASGVSSYELYRLLENKSSYQLYKVYSSPQADNFDNGTDHYGQWFRIKALENGGQNRISWSNDLKIYYEPVIFIPNAFTPDDNGRNETFRPSSGGLKTYRIVIYNRWGEKLFETQNPEVGWDGTYGGKPSPAGVYVYYCEYSDFRDKVYTTKGTLHLLR